jgi:hypothetical protein
MVGRIQYAGGGSSASVGSIPAEAQAYFARMTTAPSAAFRLAVGNAITKWKAQGNFAKLVSLVLFCADTSQAALLDISGNSHDATITGSPTFTANKGFSNFSASNGIAFNLTSTNLVDDNFVSIFAGLVSPISGAALIDNSTSGLSSTPGNFVIDSTFGYLLQPNSHVTGISLFGGTSLPVICGARDRLLAMPGYTSGADASPTGRQSNYKTALIAPHPLNRLAAYGALLSTASADDGRRFMTVLAQLLDDVGALQ